MIKGNLEVFFETGTEGVYFAVFEKDKKGYAGLHIIHEGDYLSIKDDDKIVYSQEVLYDKEKNLSHSTAYPYPRQVIGGLIVHAVPKDVNPDTWISWFVRELPCTLEKKVKDEDC